MSFGFENDHEARRAALASSPQPAKGPPPLPGAPATSSARAASSSHDLGRKLVIFALLLVAAFVVGALLGLAG
jgi:hypothetical protein